MMTTGMMMEKPRDEHEHEQADSEIWTNQFRSMRILNCTGLASVNTRPHPHQRFPEIEHLEVEWVWSGGQGSTRLEQTDRSFNLKGQ